MRKQALMLRVAYLQRVLRDAHCFEHRLIFLTQLYVSMKELHDCFGDNLIEKMDDLLQPEQTQHLNCAGNSQSSLTIANHQDQLLVDD